MTKKQLLDWFARYDIPDDAIIMVEQDMGLLESPSLDYREYTQLDEDINGFRGLPKVGSKIVTL